MNCPTCGKEFESEARLNGHIGGAHRALKPVKHGTVAGYLAERRRGLQTCRSCRRAWRIYYQRRNGWKPTELRHRERMKNRERKARRLLRSMVRVKPVVHRGTTHNYPKNFEAYRAQFQETARRSDWKGWQREKHP